jgi:hypothetical protein
MDIINLSSAAPDVSTRSYTKLIALVIALTFTLSLLIVYAILYQRHERELAAQQKAKAEAQAALKPTPTPTPDAQIFQDEAFLKGSQAVLGGRVRNISNHRMENLSLALELTSRDGSRKERRVVPVSPADLSPNEEGRYTLIVPSRQWANAELVSLRSGSGDIAFRGEMGALRPLEQPSARPGSPPPVRSTVREGDIINTPETAVTVH